MKRAAVVGEPPLTVCDDCGAGLFRGASWGDDGSIVFAKNVTGLWRVSAEGGEPELLLSPESDRGEYDYRFPDVLPGGEAVLFTITFEEPPFKRTQIGLLVPATGERRVVVAAGHHPRYSETGHIVYILGDRLWAVPFDLGRLEVTGEAQPLVGNVLAKPAGSVDFAVGKDSLLYVSGAWEEPEALVWVDREGREEPLDAPPASYSGLELSSSGDRLAVAYGAGGTAPSLWVYDLAGSSRTRLTTPPWVALQPRWTPDDRRIVVNANGEPPGPNTLHWMAADGTGAITPLTESQTTQRPSSWTPGGETLLFTEDGDIMALETHDGTVYPLLETAATENNPTLSPNGRWLAYDSDESGDVEVYVRPFPDLSESQVTVSAGGGSAPLWAPDGRELFYRGGEAMMAVSLRENGGLQPGTRSRLFPDRYSVGNRRYDLAPDGRFLMVRTREPSQSVQLNIVLDWTGILRAPTVNP